MVASPTVLQYFVITRARSYASRSVNQVGFCDSTLKLTGPLDSSFVRKHHQVHHATRKSRTKSGDERAVVARAQLVRSVEAVLVVDIAQ